MHKKDLTSLISMPVRGSSQLKMTVVLLSKYCCLLQLLQATVEALFVTCIYTIRPAVADLEPVGRYCIIHNVTLDLSDLLLVFI